MPQEEGCLEMDFRSMLRYACDIPRYLAFLVPECFVIFQAKICYSTALCPKCDAMRYYFPFMSGTFVPLNWLFVKASSSIEEYGRRADSAG